MEVGFVTSPELAVGWSKVDRAGMEDGFTEQVYRAGNSGTVAA